MKLNFLIFAISFLFIIRQAEANYSMLPVDSAGKPLKESVLLKKYGKDDTAAALIRYWFGKRYLFMALSGGIFFASAGAGIVVARAGTHYSSGVGNAGGFYYMAMVMAAALGGILALFLVIPLLTHSRKKLIRLLESYTSGKLLPKKYRERIHIPIKKE